MTAHLPDRALISLQGPDAAEWLQGLVTQNMLDLGPDELRHTSILTPQGKLLADFLVGAVEGGLLLDVAASARDGLIARLGMYRLRAQVTLSPMAGDVYALWGDEAQPGLCDPRMGAIGRRLLAPATPPVTNASLADYIRHRRALGVAEAAADGLADKVYPIEANYDLLNGIDFRKGCFVGQETTSRMKRRGTVKSRILPFTAADVAAGDEVLNGTLRAGEVLAAADGVGLGLFRLDRLDGELSVHEHGLEVTIPNWIEATPPSTGQS